MRCNDRLPTIIFGCTDSEDQSQRSFSLTAERQEGTSQLARHGFATLIGRICRSDLCLPSLITFARRQWPNGSSVHWTLRNIRGFTLLSSRNDVIPSMGYLLECQGIGSSTIHVRLPPLMRGTAGLSCSKCSWSQVVFFFEKLKVQGSLETTPCTLLFLRGN